MKRSFPVQSSHKQQTLLSMATESYCKSVLSFFEQTINQDKGFLGDITSKTLIGPDDLAEAQVKVTQQGIIAGLEELRITMSHYGLTCETMQVDGSFVEKNTVIAKIRGKGIDILVAERTILNFLQRMSGIATLTAKFVSSVTGEVLICPTRKTFWPLLDKKACVIGGGGTHRLDLSDALLVKDNHFAFFGKDYDTLFRKLLSANHLGRFIEVEVENKEQAFAVGNAYHKYIYGKLLQEVPFFILFDNMPSQMIKAILEEFKTYDWFDNMYYEASGGVTLKNVHEYAATGVDVISVGALTHSAKALDISLEIVSTC